MSDLAKYFLALAVVATGFYVAQKYRRPELQPKTAVANSKEEIAVGTPRDGPGLPTGSLPVAALADVDRVPLLGSDRDKARAKFADPDAVPVAKQPVIRSEKLAEDTLTSKPAKDPSPNMIQTDTGKQASAKSSPKKHSAKKAAKANSATSTKEAGSVEAKSMPNDADAVPPEFAREYHPHFSLAENASDPSSAVEPKGKPRDKTSSSQAGDAPATRPQPDAAPARRHRIVEGDTLPRLAEKYLGSRDRYLDLFQANSDVLFDPRMIPIGVEIVIPEPKTAVAQASGAPTTSSGNDSEEPFWQDKALDDLFSVPATNKD